MEFFKKNNILITFTIFITLALLIVLFLMIQFEIEKKHLLIIPVFFLIIFGFIKLYSYQLGEKIKNEYEAKIKKIEKGADKGLLEEWTKRKTQEIDQLKANEQFRKEFIGNVAHELKTPIFNIQGYIATLLEGAINDTNVNIKYLERSDKNVQRLVAIVKDLDIISKLETGTITPQMQVFNIVQVIKEVVEILEVKSNEYNIQIECDFKNQTEVYADKEKITEVLHNLILNSIIYGKKNGKTEISVNEKKKKILISIKDNGIGIDEKDQKHIFERFFRADKSRSRDRGGSGLGLAIVKHIIDSHNQTITVDSKFGEGTTFTFSLSKPKEIIENKTVDSA